MMVYVCVKIGVKALHRDGWVIVRQKDSHIRLQKSIRQKEH
ncbi:type II toxin-antitoxin system HicA family toxin [Candidatus Kuenenia stuttgartiensis]|nr:type II toxin-antitoxin system HicA family toxin [Candidatus Kuenenia stuttgartiensis]MCL4728096.1 type II toxin-antitoxin system HicA family toxin [Candidatus Kuenenia stuttgartiensis]